MEVVIEWLVVILVLAGIYGLYRFFKMPPRRKFEDLPVDGPMKVSITEEQVTGFNTKRIPVSLTIDVTLSQRDWKAIADMGIREHTLFMYPGAFANSDDMPFNVSSLRDKTYIGFENVPQMKEAKERLIAGLHSLRAQIDEQRSGPKKETFEI